MTAAREALEKYAAHEIDFGREWGTDSREEIATDAIDALRAVLDLHVQLFDGRVAMCKHDGYSWPCPTVHLIQTALGDTTP